MKNRNLRVSPDVLHLMNLIKLKNLKESSKNYHTNFLLKNLKGGL